MSESDLFERIQARQRLEEVNHFILHQEGEILEAPGKLSLVWTEPISRERRFLAIKLAGEDAILVNGRRYPATETGLQQGIRAVLTGPRA